MFSFHKIKMFSLLSFTENEFRFNEKLLRSSHYSEKPHRNTSNTSTIQFIMEYELYFCTKKRDLTF